MKYIIRIAIVFCFIISPASAEKLEVKLSGKSIKLSYWPASKVQHGAVALINGGSQARWSILLAHLAQKLAENGWSAVLLNCDQSPESWIKELPEAINALRQKNNRIVVLHYGEGLKDTINALGKDSKITVEGLILLSAFDMPNTVDKKSDDKKADEKKPELTIPIFDITGQFDYDNVIEQKSAREKELTQKDYLAKQIPGAQHEYVYSRQLLLSFIYGWMLQLKELKPPPTLTSYIEPIEPLMPKQIAYDEDTDQQSYAPEPLEEPTQEIIAP